MEEQERVDLYEQTAIAQAGQQAQAAIAAQYYLEEQERGLAETQLDVETIISKIYHLLKQDILKPLKDGQMDWVSIPEKDRVLTDWAVDKLMQIINFYINKNNLLSNYDEDQINRLMYRFTTEINDLIFLKYEAIFRKPTFEECKNILIERIEEKTKLKAFAMEIIGKTPDKEKIREELLQEVELRVEKEISKIRQEKLKEAIREYGLMTAELETMVLATFNRAWRGEERGSIRRHQQISEIIGTRPPLQKGEKGGIFGRWIGR